MGQVPIHELAVQMAFSTAKGTVKHSWKAVMQHLVNREPSLSVAHSLFNNMVYK